MPFWQLYEPGSCMSPYYSIIHIAVNVLTQRVGHISERVSYDPTRYFKLILFNNYASK